MPRSLIPFLLLLLAVVLLLTAPTKAVAEGENAYEALREHGLPMGLLPKGVKDFSIDEEGRFKVRLEAPCNARFENEVHYDANVSGSISYGQIGELQGISAQELFLWFPVKGIRVDIPSSGVIYFDVGVIHKQFSQSLFDTPPDCLADDSRSVSSSSREGVVSGVISESAKAKFLHLVDKAWNTL